MAETTHLDELALDPETFAASVVEKLGAQARERDNELVYTVTGEHSYYRDLIRGGVGAEQRLAQHRDQMGHVHAERARRLRGLAASSRFEFRVEPGRTDGQGGYFSPPAWLNRLFATANRPGRVLAGLVPRVPLPPGVSQVNVPVIGGTGDAEGTDADGADVADADLTDSAASSVVEPIAGDADIAVQLLDLSPVAAATDWAVSMDLAEAYDAQLEARLLYGAGPAAGQIQGVMTMSGTNQIAYTDSSPTGSELDTYLGQAVAAIGDNRLRPPECWLMRTARWAWFQTSEDLQGLPFGLTTQFYLGADDETPDPVGGLIGFPVFLDDAIPVTITGTAPAALGFAGGNQDAIVCLRPRDMLLLEGEPQTSVMREPLSGTLGVRIQYRNYVAALTTRRPAGISVITGTGLKPITGF